MLHLPSQRHFIIRLHWFMRSLHKLKRWYTSVALCSHKIEVKEITWLCNDSCFILPDPFLKARLIMGLNSLGGLGVTWWEQCFLLLHFCSSELWTKILFFVLKSNKLIWMSYIMYLVFNYIILLILLYFLFPRWISSSVDSLDWKTSLNKVSYLGAAIYTHIL